MKSIFLATSILLNIIFVFLLLIKGADGCAEISNGKLGVLSKDIKAGVWNSNDVMLSLPKGLVVRDASANGAGWFEPHRFKIVVTSDDKQLVDYSANTNDANPNGELYSGDVSRHETLGRAK